MYNWEVKTARGPGDYVWFMKDKEARYGYIKGLEYRDGVSPYSAYIVTIIEGDVAVLCDFCFDNPIDLEKAYENSKDSD